MQGGVPRWTMAVVAAAAIVVGVAAWLGLLRDPRLAKGEYVGTVEVMAEDARHYRPLPFEWRVASNAGTFAGRDTAHIRIDPSGEKTVICGWLRMDKAGASMRATRWLAEARLVVGDIEVAALFIAPTEKAPGDPSTTLGTGGLAAGCLRLDEARPAADAPLRLEGEAVRE